MSEPLTPMAVGPEPNWNESAYVFWHDRDNGLAGWHRLAQRPNAGHTSTFCCVARDDGLRYRVMREFDSFEPEHRGDDGWRGAGLELRWDSDELLISYSSSDCEVDLRWRGFYPAVDHGTALAGYGDQLHRLVGDHVEQAAAVTGRVRLGSDEYDVDALGYRDHSWGPRDVRTLLCTRWLIGTVGPELSFSGTTVVLGPAVVRLGYVVRNGEVTAASEFDVKLLTEPDGLSHRSAAGRFDLVDGSEVSVELSNVMGGGVLTVDPWVGLESAGEARSGDLVGVGNCETCHNLTGGDAVPPVLVGGGAVAEGLHTPQVMSLADLLASRQS